MLVAIRENGNVEPIMNQTHEKHFSQWMRNLQTDDFQHICEALNTYIDREGQGEIVTSSWIPGADWTHTPYQPIYESVGEDWQTARFFYGLILWRVKMDRSETWAFGRYPRQAGDVIGLTYFRVWAN
jgi:hypothetical protein